MYFGSRKYTREGRDRYGSAIFINDLEEDVIDILRGAQRNQSIIVVFFILAVSKIFSANVLGLLITLPFYYYLYFITEKKVTLSFTQTRLLYSSEYNNPWIIKAMGNTLIIISIYIILANVFPEFFRSYIFSINAMELVLSEIGISSLLVYRYRLIVSPNLDLFLLIDQSLTIVVNIWFAIQFKSIGYEFEEINQSQISEQLVQLDQHNGGGRILLFVLVYFFIQILLLLRFSFILPIILYIIYKLMPRKDVIRYSIFGPLSRPLVSNIEIPENNYKQLERVTAATFGYTVGSRRTKDFPANLIPPEAGSSYRTGLRANLLPALRQANILGFLISTLINTVVFLVLFRFATIYIPSERDFVALLSLGLLGLSILIFLLFRFLNILRHKFQPDEALIIGPTFLGRYIGKSLWIISGNKLQGSSVRRGVGRPMIRYDKVRGVEIGYQRLFFLVVLAIIISTLSFWNYMGAVNLSSLVLLAPFFFELGREFLQEKATADLSFFIIAGYVIWGILMLIYPRIYAGSRPSLYLDLQSADITPIILRDFDDHRDASLDFTKSLINTSRPKRRGTQGRPGLFWLQLRLVEASTTKDKNLLIYSGPHQKFTNLTLSPEMALPLVIEEKIMVSGKRGFPELELRIEDPNTEELISEQRISMLFRRSKRLEISGGTFRVVFEVSLLAQKG